LKFEIGQIEERIEMLQRMRNEAQGEVALKTIQEQQKKEQKTMRDFFKATYEKELFNVTEGLSRA